MRFSTVLYIVGLSSIAAAQDADKSKAPSVPSVLPKPCEKPKPSEKPTPSKPVWSHRPGPSDPAWPKPSFDPKPTLSRHSHSFTISVRPTPIAPKPTPKDE
ncbi:hypothetical protein ACEQ8H_008176 [Pleosporales sp. CAS-2024a]